MVMTRKLAQLAGESPQPQPTASSSSTDRNAAESPARNTSAKQRRRQNIPSEQEHSSEDSEQESHASSSSSECNTHPDQPRYFTLHRHLDYPSDDAAALAGIDLFAGQIWELDPHQLKQFPQLNDTDLVQIHYPEPIKPQAPPKQLTLADILPAASQSTTTTQDTASTTRLPKIPPGPSYGSPVSSLYYSAYSSFAPCYDSTGSSQSIDLTRLHYHSQKKIQDWSQRSNRYFNILDELAPLPTELFTSKKQPQEHVATSSTGGRGRRKRQKTASSAPAPPESPDKESSSLTASTSSTTPLETPEQIRQSIDSTLIETSKLIQNLQERQFDRLRLSQQEQQDAHLDPLLSAPSSSSILPTNRDHSFLGRTVEPSREELEEANQLIHRLTLLIARRPRPDLIQQPEPIDQNVETEHDVDEKPSPTLVPSLESIRKAYETLASQSLTESSSKTETSDSYYFGQLPANNPIGIHESTLVSQPDAELILALEQAAASNTGVGRTGANMPSRWDPSLSTPRAAPGVNFNGDLISSNHRQNMSGSVLSKLRSHVQSQPLPSSSTPHASSTPGIHQDQLNGFLDSQPHFNPRNMTQIEQQKHLQHLQVQKLLSSMPNSNASNKHTGNHVMRSIPPISSPSPIPQIIPPSLPPTHNTRLMNNAKSIPVPSYNGLGGGPVGLSHFVGFSHSDPSLIRETNINLDSHPNYKALASNSASFSR